LEASLWSSSYEGKGRPSIRASYRASYSALNRENAEKSPYSPLDQEGSLPSYIPSSPSSNLQEEPTLEQLHHQAIAPILEKAPIKRLLAFLKVPIPEKRLYVRQAAIFIAIAYKAAKAFLKKPTERTLLYFLLLPRILGLGLQKGGLDTLLRSYPANILTLESL
jgi:hypothetical protein